MTQDERELLIVVATILAEMKPSTRGEIARRCNAVMMAIPRSENVK